VGAARAAAALLGGAPPRLDSVTEQAVVWERLRALPATRAAAWGAGIESIAAPWPAWNALQPQIAVLESLQAAARRQSCVETGLCALGEAAPADWEALASLVEWLSNHLAEAVCWQQRLESAHSDEDTALEAARAAMWAQFANSPVAIRNWTELSQAAEAWRAEYAGAYACWHGQVFSPERRAALSALRAEPATPLVPAFGVVGALRPLVADAQAALERAEGQWCAAVGTTGPLTTAARCECGLRLDEDRAGLDAAALRAQRDAALAAVRAWLLEPDRAARLRRRLGHAAARPLYQALGNWAARGEAAPLAALLPDAISVLQAALEGEPAAARPVTALAESLRGRELSVTAAREVFTAWLDPDSSLRAGDLVRME